MPIHRTWRIRSLSLFAWMLVATGAPAEEPQPNALLLAAEPEVIVTDEGEAIVKYETLAPVPAGVVYYGFVFPDHGLDYPRWRFRASEKPKDGEPYFTQHTVSLSLKRLPEEGSRAGRDVFYRIEVYGPKAQRSRFLDRRFRYERSEEGRYRRIPCIVEGPLVDCVSTEGAIVSWRTDWPVFGKVSVGEKEFLSFDPAGDPNPRTMHEVQVAGLSVDTSYPYQVGIWSKHGASSVAGRFRTAPTRRRPGEFSFAVMCDSRAGVGGGEYAIEGVNTSTLRRFFTEALNRGVSLICFPGDLCNGGTASERDMREQLRAWKRASGPIGRFIPIYEIMGNHERLYSRDPYVEAVFADEFVNPRNGPEPEAPNAPTYLENVFSFDYGNGHFCALNTNYWHRGMDKEIGGKPGNIGGFILPGQMDWLRQDLEQARRRGMKHLFVFAHQPAFPNGGHLESAMYYHGKIPEVLAMRDEFWGILSQNKVVAAFFGDEHNYCRSRIGPDFDPKFPNDVWQIVTGGCGAPFYAQEETPWTQFVEKFSMQQHWCRVTVKGSRVELEARGFNDELIEKARLR